LFKELSYDDRAYLLHSVNLPYHKYKQWAEIDFLLISKKGVLVFEVKGGEVYRYDGIWYGKDRWGNEHRKSEGPNNQANSAMFALKKDLQKKFPHLDTREIVFGWGLIFPDIDYAADTLELPRELVCDADQMQKEQFSAFISNLYSHWEKKSPRRRELLPHEIDSFIKYIRPNLELVQTLRSRLDQTYMEQVKLTERQYELLDSAKRTKRILCTGGAGTGKTFIAVELAKREAATRKTILFVAKSKVLHGFLKAQMEEYDNIHVYTSEELLAEKKEPYKYDLLIVDEGQDLLTLDMLSKLDELLKGGLQGGIWRWFMDMNNQSGIETVVDKEGLELLDDTDPAYIGLTHNCRNTEEIVLQTQLSTGADIGIADVKGSGLSVIYKEVHSKGDAIKQLEISLKAWEKELEVLNDIVLLSPLKYERSIASELSPRWKKKIQVLDSKNIMRQDKDKILFSTIKEFKGLEKKIVAMIDLDNVLEKDSPESFIYVGMTRANSILWIEITPEYKKYWEEQQRKNVEKIVRTHGGEDVR
jgi:hypothetical protein